MQVLGLPAEDFWKATPRQYWLLMERHLDRERKDEYNAGVICATIANFSMGRPKKNLVPHDFAFPLLRAMSGAKARGEATTRINRKQIASNIRSQFDMNCGRVK